MSSSAQEAFVVAVDGPAGAGKSTVSRLLAGRLGFTLLDTGAIYRTVALIAQRRGVDWADEQGVAAVARDLDIRFRTDERGENRVFAFGEDVSEAIRTPPISQAASKVSSLPAVRQALLALQQEIGAQARVVAEGRDVGTVVFPRARAKFFLTASELERAQRRTAELRAKGQDVTLESVRQEIHERDMRDSQREVAPLARADDAVEIDSSNMSIDEVVTRMAEIVRSRGG